MNLGTPEFSDALALVVRGLALRDLLALRQVCRGTAAVSLFFWASPPRVRMLLSRHCTHALRAKTLPGLAVPVAYAEKVGAFAPATDCPLVREYLSREGIFADPAQFATDTLERALNAGDEAAADWAAGRMTADTANTAVKTIAEKWQTGMRPPEAIRERLARKQWLGARIIFDLYCPDRTPYFSLSREMAVELASEMLAAALQSPTDAAHALAVFARARADVWRLAANVAGRNRVHEAAGAAGTVALLTATAPAAFAPFRDGNDLREALAGALTADNWASFETLCAGAADAAAREFAEGGIAWKLLAAGRADALARACDFFADTPARVDTAAAELARSAYRTAARHGFAAAIAVAKARLPFAEQADAEIAAVRAAVQRAELSAPGLITCIFKMFGRGSAAALGHVRELLQAGKLESADRRIVAHCIERRLLSAISDNVSGDEDLAREQMALLRYLWSMEEAGGICYTAKHIAAIAGINLVGALHVCVTIDSPDLYYEVAQCAVNRGLPALAEAAVDNLHKTRTKIDWPQKTVLEALRSPRMLRGLLTTREEFEAAMSLVEYRHIFEARLLHADVSELFSQWGHSLGTSWGAHFLAKTYGMPQKGVLDGAFALDLFPDLPEVFGYLSSHPSKVCYKAELEVWKKAYAQFALRLKTE